MSTQVKPAVTPDRILQTMWGYAPPIILATAAHHRIFDALAQGPKTAAEAAHLTGTSERGIRPVLNALVGLQFLIKADQNRYALTPDSAAFLVSGQPGYMGEMLHHMVEGLVPRWLHLPEVVKSGRPAPRESTAEDFFETLVVGLFAMNYPAAQAVGKELAGRKPLKILDIAAGAAVWGIGIAEQTPGSTVTAVDTPKVLEVAKRFAAEHHMAGRFSYITGDMHDVDFGTGYDVAILGHIVHGEGEKASRSLLKKVAAALAPGGKIAIAEFLVNAERTGPPMPLFFAINMLVNTEQGDTYSFEEISQWLAETGFTNPRRIDPGGPGSVIVAQKA